MPRTNHLWKLDPKDPQAVPNARAVLALFYCVRNTGSHVHDSGLTDLGAAFAPVFQKHSRMLRTALQAHSRSQAAEDLAPCMSSDSEAVLTFDRSVLHTLGQAIARDLPRFRMLVDKVERTLITFVTENDFPGDRNVAMLTRLLGLSDGEAGMLRLAAACTHASIESSLFQFVSGTSRVERAIGVLMDLSAAEVSQLLSRKGRLARCGLLIDLSTRRGWSDMEDLLKLSSIGERLLGTPFESEREMALSVLNPMAKSSGMRLEWPHLERHRALLAAALRGALDSGAHGVNILVYGPPGTGKTEFVRQLADQIGADAFSVSDADEDGGEATRAERLSHLLLSQSFGGQAGSSIMVVDEAEDIFQRSFSHPLLGDVDCHTEGKAWINGLLEQNPAPVIWISNRISQLDPAYLRRFSYCLEFPSTPYALRRAIAQQRLGALGCSDSTVEFASALPAITPAHLDIAARFATIGGQDKVDVDETVRSVLESHLRAGGHRTASASPARATRFDLRYLNVQGNTCPTAVVQSLHRRAATAEAAAGVAMLFSGPPGTGKTELAGEIAAQLGLRLVVRTASDIHSKWYGESEGNVASMFRDCDPRTELLLLDEAEVLLSARDQGSHRADRAVTAEFLRWLELFQGIFICATNHADLFDPALMRRFTFRMDFQPLLLQQRVDLYAELSSGWRPESAEGSTPVDAGTRRELERLDGLTPGDFANAARRMRALGLPASAWLEELQAEHRSKSGAKSAPMGFV